MAKPLKKGWKFYLAYLSFLLILLVAAAEVSLRLLGFEPWQARSTAFHVEPGPSFFAPDSLLGFKGKTGTFSCRIGDEVSFHLTHDSTGFRNQPEAAQLDTVTLPEIWVFGCSFTHGYGVNDDETWPSLAQKNLKGYRVRNFGMTAFSTYQCSLLLEDLLEKPHGKVSHVVYAYGGFHKQRNTASRFWRKALNGQGAAAEIHYPYLRKGPDGWSRKSEPMTYHPWMGQTYSALVHFLETQANHREEENLASGELTNILIHHMAQNAHAAGAKWILATIQSDEGTRNTIKSMSEMTIFDISANLDDPRYRLLPQDGHPNKYGHAMMAGKFLEQFPH